MQKSSERYARLLEKMISFGIREECETELEDDEGGALHHLYQALDDGINYLGCGGDPYEAIASAEVLDAIRRDDVLVLVCSGWATKSEGERPSEASDKMRVRLSVVFGRDMFVSVMRAENHDAAIVESEGGRGPLRTAIENSVKLAIASDN